MRISSMFNQVLIMCRGQVGCRTNGLCRGQVGYRL
jgi:hypothetical protein